jgi:hypothetical protein
MSDSGQPSGGSSTRVSFEDWVMVAPSVGTAPSPRASCHQALEPDGREPVALFASEEDEEEAAAMRMGRLKMRPAAAPFNVDALLRQEEEEGSGSHDACALALY